MKKILLLFGALFMTITISLNAQITTIPFSPASSLSASCLHTNDKELMSWSQELSCGFCGQSYLVAADHYSTTSLSIASYTFQPNFNYAVQVNGSATAVGDLKTPSSTIINVGVSLGTPVYTNQPPLAFALFPSYVSSGIICFIPPFPATWQGLTGEDLTTTFLTNMIGYGSLPNSSATSTTTIASQFTVNSPVTGLNIEPVPVWGDLIQPTTISEDGGTDLTYWQTTQAPTNVTLNINSVTITRTNITPTISGVSSLTLMTPTSSSSGIIHASPGATVTVIAATEGPGNIATFILSGATFTSNTSGTSLTVLTASNGSYKATFVMPSSGSVNWSGSISAASMHYVYNFSVS